MRLPINYLKEVAGEMTKVVWPQKKDVIKLTMIVILFSVIVAAYVGLLDYTFVQVLERIV